MLNLVGKDVGPFAVERELGSGAMGAVYLAYFKEKGRHVALKFMMPNVGGNATAQQRFEREFEILKQLKHPNIVRLIAHGKYMRMPFYAMEFVEGESLDKVLARRGRLPWEELVALGKQLCAALQHAHEQGIVHRDLKPSNLMVTKEGVLKLTDFGIAKDLDVTQITSANCTVGTASYMSPEQCKGERTLSHKSDLYSLGIVFYELLTGQKPFLCENAMDMFLAHVKGKFERPSRHVLDIPVFLDNLVCQLMEKKPEKRPRDALMVSTALDEVTQKVAVLKSAGVDAVETRTAAVLGSRSKSQDREAARTVAQSIGRGRRKKTGSVVAAAVVSALLLVAALAGLIGFIVWALKPPPADELFAEVQRVVESKDQQKIDKAYNMPSGAISHYLRLYGDRKDEPTKKVWEWVADIESEQKERALANLMKLNIPTDDEIERKARSAIRHEDNGEYLQAVAAWEALKTPPADANRDQRAFNRVADRHLRDLASVDTFYQEAKRKLELSRSGQDIKSDSEAEKKAMEALRAQEFGDYALATNRWADLRTRHESDRPWYLLAARQTQETRAKAWPALEAKEGRLKLIRDQLAKAREHAMKGEIAPAVLLARDIMLLYGDIEDLKDLVTEARNLAAQLTPQR